MDTIRELNNLLTKLNVTNAAIAKAVGDDKQRTVGRKILGAFEQINRRLKDGATAPLDLHFLGDGLGAHIALIVSGGVAENHAHQRHVAGDAVARDGSQAAGEEATVHGAGCVQHDSKGASVFSAMCRHPQRTRDVHLNARTVALAVDVMGASLDEELDS